MALTTTQKADLANKIQNAEDDILSRAVQIIATTQNVEAVSQILPFTPLSLSHYASRLAFAT